MRRDRYSALAKKLQPHLSPARISTTIVGDGGGDHVHEFADLDGELLPSQAPWAVTQAEFNPHDMLSKHSYTGGAALDVFGLSAPSTLAKLTPSSDPGGASAILKSDVSGILTLPQFIATTKVRSPLIDTASGNLQVTPAGSFVKLGANKGIETDGTFISGFTGAGLRIDDGITKASKTYIEADNLTIRGTMRVYELLIQQIRMTNGGLLVSSTGKVKAVSGSGPYTITTDGKHGFAVGDLILAQRWNPTEGALTGTYIYRSGMQVTSITTTGDDWQFVATLIEDDAPIEGAEYGRIGNTTDTDRQGGIYLTSDDVLAPYIDIFNDVNSFAAWSGAAKLKARIGRLDGISDATLNPSDYGLYSTNVFLKGSLSAGNGAFIANSDGANILAFSSAATWSTWGRALTFTTTPAAPTLTTVAGQIYGQQRSDTTPTRNHLRIQAQSGTDAGIDDAYVEIHANNPDLALGILAAGITLQASATLGNAVHITAQEESGPGYIYFIGTQRTRHLEPYTLTDTYDIGTASIRYRTIYARDLIVDTISGATMSGAEWEYTGNMVIDANSASTTTVSVVNQGAGVANLTVDGTITSGGTAVVLASRTVTAGSGLTGGGALSSNITISHDDTSSQASVDNSGYNVIQDITLDTYGHITAIASVDVATALAGYLKADGSVDSTGLQYFSAGTKQAKIVVPTDNTTAFAVRNAADSRSLLNLDATNNVLALRDGAGIFLEVRGSSALSNLGVGTQALAAVPSGSLNLGVGEYSLYATTTGFNNSSFGAYSLFSNTGGYLNVALGSNAMLSNQTGAGNLAAGASALFSNLVGNFNVAIGTEALRNATTSYNTAVGSNAMYSTTTGYGNMALGNAVMYSNVSGTDNLAAGTTALWSNVSGSQNVAMGAGALYSALGSGNVAIGYLAGYAETGSNKLYIANSSTANPLIKGDFSAATLTINGVLYPTAGTAGAPAISQSGDTNTGILWSAADTLGLSTGGTQRVTVTTSSIDTTVRLNAAPDTDSNHFFGRAAIGQPVTNDSFSLAHYDNLTSTNYALHQYSTGETRVNAANAQTVSLSIAGTPQWVVNSDRLLPRGDSLVDIGDYNRKVRVANIAELHAETLVAKKILSTVGGDILVTPTTKLIAAIAAATGAPGASSLYTNTVAYWALDETTGSREDSRGDNDLSGAGVSYATGKQGNALVTTGSNSSAASDNAALSTGNVTWYFATWIYPTNDDGNLQCVASKGQTNSNRSWALRIQWAVGYKKIYLDVWDTVNANSGTPSGVANVGATTFGDLSVNTWYFVECWHNASTDQIGIAVNRTENTTSFSAGTYDDSGPFTLGQMDTLQGYIGRIDETIFVKGYMPNTTDRDWLYNSGAGRTYTNLYQYGSSDINFDVEDNNLRSGEYVIMKAAPAGVAQFERFKMTSGASAITNGYRYTATRDLDMTGSNTWEVGAAVASEQKNAGEGFLWLTSTATEYSHTGPGMIGYVRTSTDATGIVPTFVTGNLRSFLDYVSDEFGNAAGNNLTLTPTSGFRGYSLDRTNGLRLFNADISVYESGNPVVTVLRESGVNLASFSNAATWTGWSRAVTFTTDPGAPTEANVLGQLRGVRYTATSPTNNSLDLEVRSGTTQGADDAYLTLTARDTDSITAIATVTLRSSATAGTNVLVSAQNTDGSTGTITLAGITSTNQVRPLADNTYDIGTSSLYYTNGYIRHLYIDQLTPYGGGFIEFNDDADLNGHDIINVGSFIITSGTLQISGGDIDLNGNDIIDIGTIGDAWSNLSFTAGWGNYGGSFVTGQYKRVGDLVFLRGFVVRTSGSSANIATLPGTHVPLKTELFAITSNNAAGVLTINGSGVMTLDIGSPTVWVSLSGIVFSTI